MARRQMAGNDGGLPGNDNPGMPPMGMGGGPMPGFMEMGGGQVLYDMKAKQVARK